MSKPENSRENDRKEVHVTVRTPAGMSQTFGFKLNQLVIAATGEAVAFFVGKNQLADGDYEMNLIRNGESIDLADTEPLGDYGVRDGDVLHLVPEAPQVDG